MNLTDVDFDLVDFPELLFLAAGVFLGDFLSVFCANSGDAVRHIESFTDPTLDRDNLIIQPDGTISLRLLGQVAATGRTVKSFAAITLQAPS